VMFPVREWAHGELVGAQETSLRGKPSEI